MGQEKQFENRIKKYLASVGVYPLGTPRCRMPTPPVGYYEKRHGSMFTKKGLPDMHICINGQSIEAEIKAENGVVDDLQAFMIEQINDSRGCALVVYPRHFEQFKNLIEGYL